MAESPTSSLSPCIEREPFRPRATLWCRFRRRMSCRHRPELWGAASSELATRLQESQSDAERVDLQKMALLLLPTRSPNDSHQSQSKKRLVANFRKCLRPFALRMPLQRWSFLAILGRTMAKISRKLAGLG